MIRYSAELRAEVAGNVLRGHAAVFGQVAQLPTHLERLAPGAFDVVLSGARSGGPESAPDVLTSIGAGHQAGARHAGTDARALINHDPNLLLGRQSAGTLRLSTDSEGLAFEVDLPDTTYARDLRLLVERGDLTGASFGFVPGEDEWSRVDGRRLRTHTRIARLLDVSPVTFPAYDATDVALRSMTFGDSDSRRSQLIRARARARGLLRGVSQ